MSCKTCGAHAETKYVTFHQNIGALVLRFSSTMQGKLCKSCIRKYFWEYTTITLFAGWWGIISFFVTPAFLINNVVQYLGSRGMAEPGSSDYDDEDPPARPIVSSEPTENTCFLCGKSLRSDERADGVCESCR